MGQKSQCRKRSLKPGKRFSQTENIYQSEGVPFYRMKTVSTKVAVSKKPWVFSTIEKTHQFHRIKLSRKTKFSRCQKTQKGCPFWALSTSLSEKIKITKEQDSLATSRKFGKSHNAEKQRNRRELSV